MNMGFFKDYLSFTRKERIAVLGLVFVILVIWFLPKLKLSSKSEPVSLEENWITEAKKLRQEEATESDKNEELNVYSDPGDENQVNKKELFYFDPNNLSIDGWKKLGLREKTIRTIQNYLNKGGHFYKAEDLQKIYGLGEGEYKSLKPFIRIGSTGKKNEPAGSINKQDEPFKGSFTKKSVIPVTIDINEADTSAFISLPGIGSKLSLRIINFREKLGGFYSIDQVAEVFGLADSVFRKIRPWLKLEDVSVKKININEATVDELKSHPYIRYNLARLIVSYRDEHGFFSAVADLKKMTVITDEVYNKIALYLLVK